MYEKGEAPYILKLIRISETYHLSLRELLVESRDNIELMMFVKECDIVAAERRSRREAQKRLAKQI